MPESEATELRRACQAFLHTQLPTAAHDALSAAAFTQVPAELLCLEEDTMATNFGVAPFLVEKARVPPHPFCSGARLWLGSVRDDEANELLLMPSTS